MTAYFKPLFTTLLFCFCLSLKAQREKIKFGAVSLSDLQSDDFEKYEDAEAVVLFDGGVANFIEEEGRFIIVFERTRRIKILTKSGLDFSNINIPYYQQDMRNTELIYDIKAMSHTLVNGVDQKNELNKSDIYDEKINSNWHQKKFAIPGVKEGSVIEYSYILKSPFMFNLPDWEFQSKIPTQYSEYEVHVVPFYEYTYLAQGIKKFDYSNSHVGIGSRRFATIDFKEMVYEFAMKDTPAFTDVQYITSINDYIIKMDWQLAKIIRPNGSKEEIITTWAQMVESMLKSDNFGKFIKSSSKSVEKMIKDDQRLQEISKLENFEKAKELTRYVKENYRWNRMRGKYASKNVKEFLNETTGSTAELNLFLIGMLRAFDIEAYPVILSTRDHGKIKIDYPFESFFNTLAILVEVDQQLYLTEATEKELEFGKLPAEYLNEKGLIIDNEKQGWVDLNITLPSLESEDMKLTLNPSTLKLEGEFVKTLTDYDALRYIRNKNLIQTELNNSYNLIGDIQYPETNSPSTPYTLKYEASYPVSTFEGKIYFHPFLNKAPTINPLKAEDRTYPVDFTYSQKKQFNTIIEIPDGYSFSVIPESVQFSNSLIDFSFETLLDPSKQKMIAISTYVLKKAVYDPKEYKQLKSYLAQITEAYNKQITVEKQ